MGEQIKQNYTKEICQRWVVLVYIQGQVPRSIIRSSGYHHVPSAGAVLLMAHGRCSHWEHLPMVNNRD